MEQDNSGRGITYNTYSKPERIVSNQGITDYRYGADRNRYKRIEASSDGTNGTTFYLGNVEFISKADGTRLYKRYIGGVAIQDLYLSSDSSTLSYTHKDHIGSIDTITEGDDNASQGHITEAMSFGAWGERREAINWQLPMMGVLANLRNITPRGFTGHEMIDHAGIIHMNGRIYDSKLGRFLQADPNVQAPDNSQNLNRYSYVLNNPLSYTDPSGYFFKAIGNFVGKYWRQIAAVVIGITTAGMANQLGFWAGLAVSIAGGALAGYVSTGTLNGALIGAFSAAAFYGVGQYFKGLENTGGKSGFGKAIISNLRLSKTIAHGMTGGVISKLQGGRFAHGFISAGVTKAFSKTIAGINVGNDYGNMALQSTAAAVVGGGVSEATGGKFGNGARSAGFGYLFNELISSEIFDKAVAKSADQRFQITDEQRQLALNGERREFWESRLASGDPIAPLALDIIDNVGLGRVANEWLLLNARVAGIVIDLDQIGIELMNRHVDFTDRDRAGTQGLLSPRQVARFHHLVFRAHGLPSTAFGGTPITGRLQEANFTRDIWCRRCDQ